MKGSVQWSAVMSWIQPLVGFQTLDVEGYYISNFIQYSHLKNIPDVEC